MSDDDTLLLLRRKPRDGLSRVHSQLRRSLRAAGGDAVRVTDEMVEAARDAARRVAGDVFTPSGLLLREAIEAALAAAPQCEQEPVARVEVMNTGGNAGLATRIVEIDDPLRERLRPRTMLYAAPQPAPDDKLREAARMALEVLEALQGGCTDSDDGTVEAITVHCPEVITALREALGEQE